MSSLSLSLSSPSALPGGITKPAQLAVAYQGSIESVHGITPGPRNLHTQSGLFAATTMDWVWRQVRDDPRRHGGLGQMAEKT